MAAEFVERYFGDRKDDTYIIDVAAGTGLVGDEVSRRMSLCVRTCVRACVRVCICVRIIISSSVLTAICEIPIKIML